MLENQISILDRADRSQNVNKYTQQSKYDALSCELFITTSHILRLI